MNKTIAAVLVIVLFAGGVYFLSTKKTPTQETPQVQNEITEEHEDQKPDLALVVSESILGTWQSTDDQKFVREFKAGGVAVDYYDGKVSSTDTWKAFTDKNPLPTYSPLESDTAYVQLMTEENMALTFKVVKLTPESLELVYLDRGGMLTFTRIK